MEDDREEEMRYHVVLWCCGDLRCEDVQEPLLPVKYQPSNSSQVAVFCPLELRALMVGRDKWSVYEGSGCEICLAGGAARVVIRHTSQQLGGAGNLPFTALDSINMIKSLETTQPGQAVPPRATSWHWRR
ncbi:hypothetical protein GN956_G18913 [Arapaima gigas]